MIEKRREEKRREEKRREEKRREEKRREEGLVSILIPVYNASKYLRECLNSVVNQTYNDLQILIVNDGSTDDSQSIIEEYALKHQNIEVYHQENAGVSAARNKLLFHVRGEYVLFVDSDDWMELNMVEFLVDLIQENDSDIAVCSLVNSKIQDNTFKKEIWGQERTINEFLCRTKINGILWNKLIKSSLLNNVTFDCNVFVSEDDLFFWKIIQNKVKVIVTNKRLYYYRLNSEGICASLWSLERKGTVRLVWSSILDDVTKFWPQYIDIVQAHLVKLDAGALVQAAIVGHKYDKHIKVRQINVRLNLTKIYKTESKSNYVIALILSRWYGFGRLLRFAKKIIR